MIGFVVAFLGMEAVSYAMHRWVMHGVGWGWHRSHHEPRTGRFEKNDRFPIVFASVAVVLFATGRWGPALGVTAYGALYATVHDVYIHRRVRSVRLPSTRYLRWLREAHADHHRSEGEPYGMLLPLVRDRSSARSARARL